MFGLIIAGVITSVVATTISTIASIDAAQAAMVNEEQLLRTQEQQNQYNNLVNKNKTLDKMRLALETNEAHMAASGVASNSPSFITNNVQTIEHGDRALRNSNTATALNDYSLRLKNQALQQQTYAREVQSIAGMGVSLGNTLTTSADIYTNTVGVM